MTLKNLLFAVLAIPLHAAPAAAADWKPGSQVEIVVPNAPGGGNDAVGRLMQRIWQERRLVAAPVVVANRAGGGGSRDTLRYLDAVHVELRDVLKELGLAKKLD